MQTREVGSRGWRGRAVKRDGGTAGGREKDGGGQESNGSQEVGSRAGPKAAAKREMEGGKTALPSYYDILYFYDLSLLCS